MEKLNTWLSKLLQEKGGDIYRSKGILSIAGKDDKFVFHGVHMMLQVRVGGRQPGRIVG